MKSEFTISLLTLYILCHSTQNCIANHIQVNPIRVGIRSAFKFIDGNYQAHSKSSAKKSSSPLNLLASSKNDRNAILCNLTRDHRYKPSTNEYTSLGSSRQNEEVDLDSLRYETIPIDSYDQDDDNFSDYILAGDRNCRLYSDISSSSSIKETLLASVTKQNEQTHTTPSVITNTPSGGANASTYNLSFSENMICGAISRSVAQTLTHPANTMKTLLQSNRAMGGERLTIKKLARPKNFRMLTRGAGAQLIMSIPHGAVNFAVLELVRKQLNNAVDRTPWAKEKMGKSSAFGPTLDFVSSAIATVCCSVVSTPQMMLMDNIMAGAYPNLGQAIIGLSKEKGIAGFYTGWWPGLAGKIPSYALTWTLFQQIKRAQLEIFQRPPKDIENSIMGCMASATSVCVMIPMDTIKTRLVTQSLYPDLVPYKGIWDAALRITKEEGIGAFYRGLPPRLISVVPMIGIQFGVYEFMKKVMVGRHNIQLPVVTPPRLPTLREKRREMEENERRKKEEDSKRLERLTEVIMEVSADDEQPFPVPKH